jgi:hypothetical protein
MKMITRGGLAACTLVLALILGAPAPQTFGGKPKAPPPPTPVHYQIHFATLAEGGVEFFNPSDFNNRSQAVGWFLSSVDGQRHAWFYDPAVDSNHVIDLNTLVPAEDIPVGWIIGSAIGLNEHGDIVGYLLWKDDPNQNDPLRRGYVLNMNVSPPELTLLPDAGLGYTFPKDINNQGIVLGTYRIPGDSNGNYGMYLCQAGLYSNQADAAVRDLGLTVTLTAFQRLSETLPVQFAGVMANGGDAFRYTDDGGPLELFPELERSVRGTNQWGGFCGSGLYTPPRGKQTRVPIRVKGPDGDPEFITSLPGRIGLFVNSRGDLVIDGTEDCIYWDAYGLFGLNSLVVDNALWKSATVIEVFAINDPIDPANPKSFGEVMGRINFANGNAGIFYLTLRVLP